VRRGLRLIAGGALDDGNVEWLAARLGVTSRHLRRLFTKHLGASPLAVAHTQRLHFAKRLIDDTRLTMTEIAVAAGYGSVRRFNDAFRKSYGRSPRELRKVGTDRPPTGSAPAALTLLLPYRAPFNWTAMLEFFALRATPGVESVTSGSYCRTVEVDGHQGIVEVRPADREGYVTLTAHGVPTNGLFEVIQRIREVFDLEAPASEIDTTLARDAALRKLVARRAGMRVPGAWNGFEITVRAILGQQVSVKGATTVAGRLAGRYGEPLQLAGDSPDPGLQRLFPSPERLMRARFRNLGLVQSRADTIRRVAAAVIHGDLSFDVAQEPAEFCKALCAIKGIGDWTAQYVAMRALKHPDAWPAADLGLLNALRHPDRMKPAELAARAEAWRPWRAYAAMLLWDSLGNKGG
jgi:AraC family transcriptional regulator of adaptative response / DNA-3-methyladenine glycosylase II